MAKATRVTYFKTPLEDRPGTVLAILKDLKARNLALLGIWGFSTREGKAELYVVPKSADKLRNAWRAAMILGEEGTGFLVKGADTTGALVKSLDLLAAAGINIIALEGVASAGNYGALIWVKQEDVEKTAKALGVK